MATNNALNNVEIDKALIDAKGDLIVGSADDTPVILSIGSAGEVLTVVAGTASWEAAAPMTWTATADDTTMAVNNGYIPTDDAVRTVFTLPDTAAVGSIFRVVGEGDAGWKVAQNAGDTIRFGNVASTTGAAGYIQSSDKGDCVELVCVVANTDYRVASAVGNITYA